VRSKREMFEKGDNVGSISTGRSTKTNKSAPPVNRRRGDVTDYKAVYDETKTMKEYGPTAVWFITGGYHRHGRKGQNTPSPVVNNNAETPPPPLPTTLPPPLTQGSRTEQSGSPKMEGVNDQKQENRGDHREEKNSLIQELRNTFEESNDFQRNSSRTKSLPRHDIRNVKTRKTFASTISQQTFLNSKSPSGLGLDADQQSVTGKMKERRITANSDNKPQTQEQTHQTYQSHPVFEKVHRSELMIKVGAENVPENGDANNDILMVQKNKVKDNAEKYQKTGNINVTNNNSRRIKPDENNRAVLGQKIEKDINITRNNNRNRVIPINIEDNNRNDNEHIINITKNSGGSRKSDRVATNSDCLIKCSLCRVRKTSLESQIL